MSKSNKLIARFRVLDRRTQVQLILAALAVLILAILFLYFLFSSIPQSVDTAAPAATITSTVTATSALGTYPVTLTPQPEATLDETLIATAGTYTVGPSTPTPTRTRTRTATWFIRIYPTRTKVKWSTWTRTATRTRTITLTRTITFTRTITNTRTETLTPTVTHTLTLTPEISYTPTPTVTFTVTPTPRPDRIAFSADADGSGTLGVYTIAIDGSELVTVLQESTNSRFWDWSPDGEWLLIQQADHLYRIRAGGWDQRLIINLGSSGDAQAAWSPDGQWIVFANDDSGQINLARIHPDGTDFAWLTTNLLVEQNPSISPTDSIVYYSISGVGLLSVPILGGSETMLSTASINPDFSADGSMMVYEYFGDIISVDPGFSYPTTQLTNTAMESWPSWSKDGDQVIFISQRIVSTGEIFIMDADGENEQPIPNIPPNPFHPRWIP